MMVQKQFYKAFGLLYEEMKNSFRPAFSVAASLEISGVNVQVYAGADEPTLSALFRALSSC